MENCGNRFDAINVQDNEQQNEFVFMLYSRDARYVFFEFFESMKVFWLFYYRLY